MGSKDDKVEIALQTFKIINGKLYLFYHTFFSNTSSDWNKGEIAFKAEHSKLSGLMKTATRP